MIVHNDTERMRKEGVVVLLNLMSAHLLGGTEEDNINLRVVGVQAEIRTGYLSNNYT